MTDFSKKTNNTSKSASLETTAVAELIEIEKLGLTRSLKEVGGPQEPLVQIGNKKVLLFCSNNYLGLANHPEVTKAAIDATMRYGASSVSSRLISGHMTPHAELEDLLAKWKGVEAALVFSTGFQANIGIITSLLTRDDTVISDELNHASIIDGCRLSRANVEIFRHGDMNHLEDVLNSSARRPGRRLVVTESIFSMDGDRAPLRDLVSLAKRHGAWTMVDEAHAVGIFGNNGAGLVRDLGLTDSVDIQIGTLGKALGSFGAYVAGSSSLIKLLTNRARSFIFTTGLPPSCAAAAAKAINICMREPERAATLLQRARKIGEDLREAGLNIPHIDSQILPILIGDSRETVKAAENLLRRNIYVAAIRPPTVPTDTARLRLSLMASHEKSHIEKLLTELPSCMEEARLDSK
tara:strand:- start:9409 stop:10635 length:1227 start_codon:yes stop_codon:yes gene_type:complete